MPNESEQNNDAGLSEDHVYDHTDRIGAPREDMPESQVVTEMLEEMPSHMARAFIYLLILVLFGGIVYAYFGKMDVVVQGRGKLAPQGSSEVVQAAKPGILRKLYVQEGSRVKKGQVLADLDVTRTNLDIKKRKRQYRQLIKQKNCLELAIKAMDAIRTGQKVKIERDRILTICDSKYVDQILSLQEAKRQYEQMTVKFKQIYPTELKNLKEQITTKEINLDQKAKELEAAERDLKRNTDQVALYREMFNRGLASKIKLLEEQKNYDEALTKLNRARVEVSTAADALAEVRANLKTRKLETTNEKRQTEESFRVAVLKYQSLIKSLNLKMEAVQDGIANFELDTKLFDYTRKFDKILSPVSGTVVQVALKTPGELVQAGRTVFLINPANQPLVAKILVPNKSVGQLKPGLEAKLKFEAFPYQNYGVLPGRVIQISPDSKQIGNNFFYEITASLDREYVVRNQKRYNLFPGLTMLAEIVVEKRRIIDNFLDPLRKLKG